MPASADHVLPDPHLKPVQKTSEFASDTMEAVLLHPAAPLESVGLPCRLVRDLGLKFCYSSGYTEAENRYAVPSIPPSPPWLLLWHLDPLW